MNKFWSLLVLIISIFYVSLVGNSQTYISGSINGAETWDLSGSPYRIQSNLFINGTVVVEPGVEVIVEGPYQIDVNGYFQALGTAQQPIVFAADDTTGFHLANTTDGGWHGFYFDYTSVPNPNDISEFKHCIIKDVKLKIGAPNQSAVISSQRGMEVNDCEFFHNWCDGGYGSILRIFTTANQRNANVTRNHFHGNVTHKACVQLSYNNSGTGLIQDNVFKNNEGGVAILTYNFPDVKIERNAIDSNSCDQSLGIITTFNCNGRIGDNRVTHNTLFQQGSILSRNGILLIEKNLLCNNRSNAQHQLCGITEGGGGLHLSGDNSIPDSLKKHIVRDNIIANNSSGTWGGGIYINDIDAFIQNNTILYNSSYLMGPSIYARGDKSVYIHNNLFTGNFSTFTLGATTNHTNIFPTVALAYDYNFDVHDFSNSVVYTGNNFIGDSTHCITGNSIHMVNPTTSGIITENAADKDFRLLYNSPCINSGTTDSTILQSLINDFDFSYSARVVGDSVDIGAHEFPGCMDTIVVDSVTTCGPFTWINGVTYSSDTDSATIHYERTNTCGDSIVALVLTIDEVNTDFYISGQTVTAIQSGVQYQWLDCNHNMLPIIGETNQSYTVPIEGGSFALVVFNQGCSDTSSCIEMSSILSANNNLFKQVSLYPNPSDQHVTIAFGEILEDVNIQIIDLTGSVIFENNVHKQRSTSLDLNASPGVYVVRIQAGTNSMILKLLKQ
ncbi:MAG: T9SS type A sorting domain-containing protein [Putridiphycobacter sp.]|nr:T9SS type A sorting domain-containing protein [Putridiphycobacter sp.]